MGTDDILKLEGQFPVLSQSLTNFWNTETLMVLLGTGIVSALPTSENYVLGNAGLAAFAPISIVIAFLAYGCISVTGFLLLLLVNGVAAIFGRFMS